ncbi:MAG: hypothetical protein V2A55_02490 [Candidatus Jorgensenbacteria bacterium]
MTKGGNVPMPLEYHDLSADFTLWFRRRAIAECRLKLAKKKENRKDIKRAKGDILAAEDEIIILRSISRSIKRPKPRRNIGKRQRDRRGLTRRGRLERERRRDPDGWRRRERWWQ